MSEFSNADNIDLIFLPWLMNDEYDHNDDPLHFSATDFNRSIRQTVLGRRVDRAAQPVELSSLVASRIGTAIHNALESAWKDPELVDKALELMGYPKRVREKIVINPEDGQETEYSVYLENRSSKQLGKYTVSGKYDMVIMGRVTDYKSTSAFQVRKMSSREDYILQGSIYRWLDPEKITDDIMNVGFIVKDWSRGQTRSPDYPPTAAPTATLPLKSPEETEQIMVQHLEQLEKYMDAPDSEIPYCTPEEMWQDPPVYKYYANPEKLGRSTKNFDSHMEANLHLQKLGKGIVLTVESPRVRCGYCDARDICGQNLMYRETLEGEV